MTTASKITLVRVLMIPVFMVLLLLGYNIAALVVFIVASCTDFVDGYIARHYHQVSNFGKFLDPLADQAAGDLLYGDLYPVGADAGLGSNDRSGPGVCGDGPAPGGSGKRPGDRGSLDGKDQDGFHHGGPVCDDLFYPVGCSGLGGDRCHRGDHSGVRRGIFREKLGRAGHEEIILTHF